MVKEVTRWPLGTRISRLKLLSYLLPVYERELLVPHECQSSLGQAHASVGVAEGRSYATDLGPYSRLGEIHRCLHLCMVKIPFCQMDFVWVLPGRLDEENLCNAVARNLRDYYYGNHSELWLPAFLSNRLTGVGRLNFIDNEVSGQWSLVFNENAGVPVTFGTTARPSVMSDEFDHEVRGYALEPTLYE